MGTQTSNANHAHHKQHWVIGAFNQQQESNLGPCASTPHPDINPSQLSTLRGYILSTTILKSTAIFISEVQYTHSDKVS